MWLIFVLFLVNTVAANPHDIRNVSVTSKPQVIELPPLEIVRLFIENSEDKKFWVFEAHSRQYNISMSYNQIFDPFTSMDSTDQGLVYPENFDEKDPPPDLQPYVYLKNTEEVTFQVMVLVRGYTAFDPIPGACSEDFNHNHKRRPNIRVNWDSHVVNVSFSHAKHNHNCDDPKHFTYQVYQRFLPERNLGDASFFTAMKGFLDVHQIKKNGVAVASRSKKVNELVFSAYPATGSLYAVVVEFGNGSAVYVTGHTYACNLDTTQELNCEVLFFTVTKILCAVALFLGIFLGFAGHRFFKCSQFIFGLYTGSFVGYILLSVYLDLDWVYTWSLTATCGLAMAGLMSAMWFFLGIPVLSVFLPLLILGALAASCVMFIPVTDVAAFNSPSTYWLVYSCIVLAGPILLLAFTQKASILACVIIGVYTFIIPIDHYIGSSLRYILVNVLRRATVPYFHEAILAPPIQTPDLVLMVCWLGATAVCLIVQLVVERRKAPFPPAPYQQWRWAREEGSRDEPDERTPLVGNEIRVEGEVGQTVRPVNASGPVVGYILGYQPQTGSPVSSAPLGRDRSSNSILNSLSGFSSAPHGRDRSSNSSQGRTRDRTSNSSLGGRRNGPTSPRERDIFKPPSHDEDLFGTPQ